MALPPAHFVSQPNGGVDQGSAQGLTANSAIREPRWQQPDGPKPLHG
jgi:hypothetical protein